MSEGLTMPLGFDPDWSYEQALAAGDEGPHSPFQRWQAWVLMMDAYRASFDEGEKVSLLDALRLCAVHNLPLPSWVADGYAAGYAQWRHHSVATLDDAFGVVRPKGTHLRAKRKALELNFAVPVMIMKFRAQGRSVDEALFEDVGKALGISSSTASKAYYASYYYRRLQKKS